MIYILLNVLYINKQNTIAVVYILHVLTGVTSVAGTAHPSGAHEFTSGF
jgi:hypothetical protein